MPPWAGLTELGEAVTGYRLGSGVGTGDPVEGEPPGGCPQPAPRQQVPGAPRVPERLRLDIAAGDGTGEVHEGDARDQAVQGGVFDNGPGARRALRDASIDPDKGARRSRGPAHGGGQGFLQFGEGGLDVTPERDVSGNAHGCVKARHLFGCQGDRRQGGRRVNEVAPSGPALGPHRETRPDQGLQVAPLHALDYVDLPGGHWPMWAQPAGLADALVAIATR